MLFKLESYSNWKVAQIGMSHKLECPTNWTFTQIRVSFKYDVQSKWKVERVLNPIPLRTHL